MPSTLLWCASVPAPALAAHKTTMSSSDDGGSSQRKPLVDRVVIVGGGLGGLAAALQLRRVGIDAQVYERNSAISGGEGTLISIFPNGCKALNQANPKIVFKMRSCGLENAPAIIAYPDGTRIGEWSLAAQMEHKFGQPLIAILWRDALKILSEFLPDDCKHTGFECVNVIQEEDSAIVHLKKGDETIEVKAPLVIGADGIRSTVRTSLFGHTTPRDNGRTMWRAVIDSHLCSHKGLITGTVSSLFNGRTVFIVNGAQGKLYWALSVEDDYCEGSSKIRSKTKEESKERLLQYFEGFSLATSVIQATDPDLILERRVLDMPVLPAWSKGRTVLLGDAVHAVTPSLGQGANLAYEDGMQLAKLLTSCTDLRTALDMYQARQMPRAQAISEQSALRNAQRTDEFYEWLYNPKI